MKKKILIATTLREFRNDEHFDTQIAFLNSIKEQTYQNYELIVTEFNEEKTFENLSKLKLNFKVVKSRLLKEINECGAKYSHWEFVDNIYPFLKKDESIVISTLSDAIFEKNFFQKIIENYSPSFSGTSWPQINYKNLEDYNKKLKYDIVNSCIVKNELKTPLYKLMSDVYFFDGNIMMDEKFKSAWKNCKIHGVSHGFVPTIWFCFSNKNRINIYNHSKIHNIINYSNLNDKNISPENTNKKLWEINDKLFENFCHSLNIDQKYWKTNETFRKLFIFSSFRIEGSLYKRIQLKIVIIKSFIIKLIMSLSKKINFS